MRNKQNVETVADLRHPRILRWVWNRSRALARPFYEPWHRGGELLTESNRFQIRLVGLVLGAGALYVLYSIARH